MITVVRVAGKALGQVNYERVTREAPRHLFRYSLFAGQNIHAGEVFTGENARVRHPGYGCMASKHLLEYLGRCMAVHELRGTALELHYGSS